MLFENDPPNVMFGTLRFLLAVAVVIGHLNSASWLGTYAVFCFYIISGYFMCLVMNERYRFTLRGVWAFGLNRFLRIFPPYWVACLITLSLITLFGAPGAQHFRWQLQIPTSMADWIANVSLVPFADFSIGPLSGSGSGTKIRLVPPAWALGIELIYYLAIAIFLGRGRRISLFWFSASVAYHIYLFAEDASWNARYFPICAASLPFSMGSLIYHYRSSLERIVSRPNRWLILLGVAWLTNCFAAMTTQGGFSVLHFYVSCGVSGLLVLLLSHVKTASILGRTDAWLGDLSYPIYLLHWQIGFLVWNLLGLEKRGLELTGWTFPILFLAAWAMGVWVDDPIERVRERVKGRLRAAT